MTGNARLYKYLDINGGLSMLHYRNLQFTNATCLNDPFDCHPALFDFSNVPTNAYNWPPADFVKRKGVIDMENLRSSTWICSLSKLHDSVPMWAYYCKHSGVCIGLDMEKASKYLSSIPCSLHIGAVEMVVQYRDVVEKHDYFNDAKDYFQYMLTTKAKDWAHEQEVRLILEDPSPTIIQATNKPNSKEVIDWKEVRAYPHLGGECFESLYLGTKIDKKNKERVIEEAIKCNPNIKIYQMTVDSDAFQLKSAII